MMAYDLSNVTQLMSTSYCTIIIMILFLHALLGVRSTKRRHQSPEWTILSHVNCFIQ